MKLIFFISIKEKKKSTLVYELKVRDYLFFFSLLSIVEGLGKSYIVWQEVVDNNIKVLPDTVVNIWKAGWKKEMAKITSKGLRTILSACWYLNRIHFGIDWSKVF